MSDPQFNPPKNLDAFPELRMQPTDTLDQAYERALERSRKYSDRVYDPPPRRSWEYTTLTRAGDGAGRQG